MPLVAAGISPHGYPLIPQLSDDAEGALETRGQLQRLGALFRDRGVEVVVIAGPHGIRADGHFAVVDTARVAGTLRWRDHKVAVNAPCDRNLIASVMTTAAADGLPAVRVGYGGNSADQSVAPLDWGGLVPLWFLGHDQNEPGTGDVPGKEPAEERGPAVVLVTPSRSLSRESMIAFGHAVGRAMQEDTRRIGFISSSDWAHAHSEDGPYGFDEAAERVDTVVVDAIRRNALRDLLKLSDADVQHAAIDGLWQTLILAGVQEVTPFGIDFRSYEAPTYYGMIVATAVPDGN